jgi:antitoxin (DNA-binding transcriptional repressor) of toxin-antitoxin stability system
VLRWVQYSGSGPIKAALYTGPGLYAVVVGEGFDITTTAKGRPVAILTAAGPPRRRWLAKSEFLGRLHRAQADPKFARRSRVTRRRHHRRSRSNVVPLIVNLYTYGGEGL